MRIVERKRLIGTEDGESKQMRETKGNRGRSLRTLRCDGVGSVASQLGGRVCRILGVGGVEGLEIGRTGLVLGHRGWEFWEGVVVEAGEDLFVQVLQVHIDRRKFWGWHDCVGKGGMAGNAVRIYGDNTLSRCRLGLVPRSLAVVVGESGWKEIVVARSDHVHCQSTLRPRGCLPMVSTLLFFHGPKPPHTRSCWARCSYPVDRLFIPTATGNLCSPLSNMALTWGFSLGPPAHYARPVLKRSSLAVLHSMYFTGYTARG